MTNHSIEELRRQRDAAHQKFVEARKRYDEAENDLRRAYLEKSGYMNKVVITDRYPDGVLVTDGKISSNGVVYILEGVAIKRDGKPGQARRTIYDVARITGVCEVRP